MKYTGKSDGSKKNVNYYVDREDTSSVFKYDWEKKAGYIRNYQNKGWVRYDRVLDYIYDWDHEEMSLRTISEENAMKYIRENS